MGSTYVQLPPLSAGETAVKSFQAPVNLNQQSSALRGSTSLLQAQQGAAKTLSVDVRVAEQQGRGAASETSEAKVTRKVMEMPVKSQPQRASLLQQHAEQQRAEQQRSQKQQLEQLEQLEKLIMQVQGQSA